MLPLLYWIHQYFGSVNVFQVWAYVSVEKFDQNQQNYQQEGTYQDQCDVGHMLVPEN